MFAKKANVKDVLAEFELTVYRSGQAYSEEQEEPTCARVYRMA